VLTDFAFPLVPRQLIWSALVCRKPDPVAGPWALYAIQVDPANPTFLGDYPKLAIWNDGGTQNAYFLMRTCLSVLLSRWWSAPMRSPRKHVKWWSSLTRSALQSASLAWRFL